MKPLRRNRHSNQAAPAPLAERTPPCNVQINDVKCHQPPTVLAWCAPEEAVVNVCGQHAVALVTAFGEDVTLW